MNGYDHSAQTYRPKDETRVFCVGQKITYRLSSSDKHPVHGVVTAPYVNERIAAEETGYWRRRFESKVKITVELEDRTRYCFWATPSRISQNLVVNKTIRELL